MTRKKCAECDAALNDKQVFCACGWKVGDTSSAAQSERCCFQVGEKRCKFIGTALLGNINKLYCHAHHSARHSVELSSIILEEMEKHPEQFIMKSWRLEMLEEHLSKNLQFPEIKKNDLRMQLEKIKKAIGGF